MAEAGLIENISIELPKGGGITGVVHDRHGLPVAEELVLAFSPQGFDPRSTASSGAGLYQGRSDKQGAYSIKHVAPGSYFLVATRGDEDLNPMSFFGTLNFDLVTVPAGENVKFDLIDSSAGACRVHGRVLYKNEPVGRGNLSAINFDTDNLLGVEFKAAKMSEGGKYEFAGLAPGEYQLNFDGPDGQVRMSLEVPDQPELQIDLALLEGGLEGRVVDESTKARRRRGVVRMPMDRSRPVCSASSFRAKGVDASARPTERRVHVRASAGRRFTSPCAVRAAATRRQVRAGGSAEVRIYDTAGARRRRALATRVGVSDGGRRTKSPIANATVLVNPMKGGLDLLDARATRRDDPRHTLARRVRPESRPFRRRHDDQRQGRRNAAKPTECEGRPVRKACAPSPRPV
jgi:hypothetical protein